MSAIQFLAEWCVRSTVLILAGALLLWLLRVKNPFFRLTAWTVALAGSLTIPLLTTTVPKLPLTVLRSPVRPSVLPQTIDRGSGIQVAVPVIPQGSALAAPAHGAAAKSLEWARLVLTAYGLVSVALLLRLFIGLMVSLRILRQSRPTGIANNGIEVLESGHVASPVSIGILRPAVLLPLDWQRWDSLKLDVVLAHECSHIRRHDPAVQFVSAIHRAVLWMTPSSWLLHRTIIRVGEEISDNHAIAVSGDRVSYAEILLEFIQRGAGDSNWAGVQMARYDRPEKRIRRILDSTVVPCGVRHSDIAAILILGAPLAFLAAATHPQSASETAAVYMVPRAIAPATVEAPPAPPAKPAPVPIQPPPPPLPQFEVASIKPTDMSGQVNVGVRVYPGGRVVVSGCELSTLARIAFGLTYQHLSGGPDWINEIKYDVEAVPPKDSGVTDLRYTLFGIEDERLREMLQALLKDRFQLKFHRENKTGDIYLLERNRKPLAVHPAQALATDADPSSNRQSFSSIGYVGGRWSIFATSMPQLAKFASSFVYHTPVLDRTDLTGQFDYKQKQPDLEPKYSGDQSDSFRIYLQELGLKIERRKGPVETFVIDSAAKPSAN